MNEVPQHELEQAPTRFPPKAQRTLLQDIDYNNVNITEEELNARLAAFDAVSAIHEDSLARLGPHDSLVRNLAEAILDSKVLEHYKVPLCFREVDDDLAVNQDEVETILD
mmetsp:Transcript_46801/g.61935  ORF Transcript_46801/g.61935 Transcript_46801/m.61935 type:complete len:110 (-) Transcript_46801:245-574(-)|eukprot:CAMPEP_0185575606 /NCGR_PEP_ID=MMETSP0434-20130131/6748_1 /TAXON_ID=626734 ORGANISM="Favella taraikaensis, Strain Fe Narragansett Bay" /NCGR_SAMPLE_ID=MMETSP0434 /ASSEMBLY_ACC=CAM_ASM_000379 /LENGTH=109 /DNA_ID=CAMNT_0028192529 /DNA_START=2953 /DNA_END=3282 /DNA_ORIENTATION=+